MRDMNTKKWSEFLTEIICMSYLLLRSYQRIAFRCVPGKSEEFSNSILLIMWILGMLVGLLFFRHNKNNLSLLAVLILPLGVYTVISTYETTWVVTAIGFLIVVVSCYAYNRYFFVEDKLTVNVISVKNTERKKNYLMSCFALYVQTIVFIFLIVVVVIQKSSL